MPIDAASGKSTFSVDRYNCTMTCLKKRVKQAGQLVVVFGYICQLILGAPLTCIVLKNRRVGWTVYGIGLPLNVLILLVLVVPFCSTLIITHVTTEV